MFRHKEIDPFKATTGSDRLWSPKYVFLLLSITAASVWAIYNQGLVAGIGLVALPFLVIYFYWLFMKPVVGLYSTIVLGFILLGFSRYINSDLQLGIAIDSILGLTYIALIFNKFYDKVDWSPAKKDITLLAAIWFGYSLLQFFNPELQSRTAWLSGIRSTSLYMMMMIPLVLVLLNDRRKLDIFFYLWGVLSILASLKGIAQLTIGLDSYEKFWLTTSGGSTHMIFGSLRVFSFMTDAGQFGANQAYSAVVASIMFFAVNTNWKRIFFVAVAALGFVGMFISGTRGAISVPLSGFFLFFVLRKNVPVMIAGFVLLFFTFAFFKFTYVGQSNQFIRRMRTAFNPNDPSLQVRLENQKRLRTYLATRPFGGGIGHAGVKAKQFLPNSYLSSIATDSWYVLIWAEQGIVGLILHLFILFYIIIKASFQIMFRIRDPVLRLKLSALASGMMGVMVASYGNAVLGMMPTSMLIYTSMALLLNSKHFDDQAVSTAQKVRPVAAGG
jgi:hypothetical protein